MSRIRTVKPELFKHEDLFDAELASGLPLRLAFIGLFTVADCEGRFKWRPRTLKLEVLPHDLVDFAQVMNALERAGFIERYEVNGETYGSIPSFTKHQRIQTKELAAGSSIPAPVATNETGTHPGRTQERTSTHLESQEGKGKEGKGKGREEAAQAPPASPPVPPLSPATPSTPATATTKPTPAPKSPRPVKAPIPADWTPAETTYALLEKHGMDRPFAESCLDEFRLYWQERGERRPGWEASFVNNVKRQWQNRPAPATTKPINGKPGPFISKQDRIAVQNEAALAEWTRSRRPQVNVIEGECHEIH